LTLSLKDDERECVNNLLKGAVIMDNGNTDNIPGLESEAESEKNTITDSAVLNLQNYSHSDRNILKRLVKALTAFMVKIGVDGTKTAVKLILLVLKILSGIWFVITDVFSSVWGLAKIVFAHVKNAFKKRNDKTLALQRSVREARKLSGKEKYLLLIKSVIRYLFGVDGMFYTAFNYVLPIISVVFFLGVVKLGSGFEYGICVEYNGKQIGVITEEADLDVATREVRQRMEYVDGVDMELSPKLSIKIVSEDEQYYNSVQLANKLLSESDYELTEAYGIYIDDEFVGAVKDKTPLENALTDILVNYKADGNVRNIRFKNEVEYRYGTYLEKSVMTEEAAIYKLTASNERHTTYVAQKGDSAEVVCQKFNMQLDKFYELNPNVGDNFVQGNILKVVERESVLPIEYTRDLETITFIEYSTVEIETSSLNVGDREILVKGERGERRNNVEITYIDGIERSRTVVSSEVTKKPVVEQVGVGTYLAKPSSSSTKLYGTGEFGWPVDGGYVSDPFLSDRNHKGLDIAAPAGTDIYAAKEGVVVSAGWNPGGYGYFVMIEHQDGYETVYAHCSMLYVTSGQYVSRGQLIGAVGNTGNSYGNHLHFEVRYLGMCYDPAAFINTVTYADDKKEE